MNNQYSDLVARFELKYCDKCQSYMYGNYCSKCGTKLEKKEPTMKTCPCCGGSGKIPIYPSPWEDMWQRPYIWNQGAVMTNNYQSSDTNPHTVKLENDNIVVNNTHKEND